MSDDGTPKKSGRGGARPGAGGPRRPTRKTLDKARETEIAEQEFRKALGVELPEIIAAHAQHARGISHFFMRGKYGQFEQVEDPKMIAAALNSGDEGQHYWIFRKDPSVASLTVLLERAYGKVVEQKEVKVTGELTIVEQRLKAARARTAAKAATGAK